MAVTVKKNFSAQVLNHREQPIKPGLNDRTISLVLERIRAMMSREQAKSMDDIVRECFGEPLTFADACSDALVGLLSGEERLELGERSKRFDLAMAVVKGGELEISPEQRDMIKQCVTKYFGGATIPSRVAELLEGSA